MFGYVVVRSIGREGSVLEGLVHPPFLAWPQPWGDYSVVEFSTWGTVQWVSTSALDGCIIVRYCSLNISYLRLLLPVSLLLYLLVAQKIHRFSRRKFFLLSFFTNSGHWVIVYSVQRSCFLYSIKSTLNITFTKWNVFLGGESNKAAITPLQDDKTDDFRSSVKLELNVELKVKKTDITFYTWRRAFEDKWSLRQSMILWIYRSRVRPILMYGSIVWLRL